MVSIEERVSMDQAMNERPMESKGVAKSMTVERQGAASHEMATACKGEPIKATKVRLTEAAEPRPSKAATAKNAASKPAAAGATVYGRRI